MLSHRLLERLVEVGMLPLSDTGCICLAQKRFVHVKQLNELGEVALWKR